MRKKVRAILRKVLTSASECYLVKGSYSTDTPWQASKLRATSSTKAIWTGSNNPSLPIQRGLTGRRRMRMSKPPTSSRHPPIAPPAHAAPLGCRTPAATARIAAAAASSRARTRRPPWLSPSLSFAVAGRVETLSAPQPSPTAATATGLATTRPSAHALRNPRTSSAPS